MDLDPDAAYRALAARDARFDGQLYVGVTSTGIYCRPVCRVRTPQQRHCRFFGSAAQAEAAAFRPCLKCRPEIAPGPGLAWSVMDASRTLARQAAQALDAQAGSGDVPSLAALAERLGVSDRHLRRIFAAEHGVTPLQYLQTRRLLLAKQLLTDSALPVAQVALASGFRSLRRFNACFVQRYRMSPSRLRGAAARSAGSGAAAPETVALTLSYRTPYDQAALLRFVAQRAIPGIEQVDGVTIRRSLRAGSVAAAAGWIEASFLPEQARVRLRFAAALAPASARLVALARRWLDLDAAPQTIDAALVALPGAPGIRLPGSLDAFELAVRAVLGQQVTVAAARTLASRLVARFGTPLATPWDDITRAFPAPERLSDARLEHIAELGIVRTRAQALVALAQAWATIAALIERPGEPQALVDALTTLPGIGAWTAHYIAMRAAGWPDAFPPGDVAVLKALRRRDAALTPRAALAQAEAWRPWRAYAVLRLWNSLSPAP
ncbi:MAG: helix-turn-helix domain-containing protein [Piscinibacter sp.]|uniref:DNA-3-methyladenine glycosylase 2 family protein n=1 Tax=Piscinibacter sp. TaxID=1903157 RepID=UPI002589D3EB|nr:AlkA N-terminal domain-containing protein [Piscinibacter sp.]MCW5662505.1 helix-turn-helix domain-containing protein [Piscinibacter sp.]